MLGLSRLRIVLVLLLLAGGKYALYAQNNRYQFSHLDITNGLSHNQVNRIFKDSQGFMWFGTASGLNRYDGYTFKIFKHDGNNKNSVRDDYIDKIFEGPDKKLWISARDLYCFYDPETEQFNSDMTPLLRSLKLPVVPNLSKIVRSGSTDFLFLFPDSGIYRYSALTKQTTRYYRSKHSTPSLYSNSIADITTDTKGNVWITYSDGIVEMLDVKLGKINYHTDVFNKAINNKKGNYSVTVDRDGDLWFYNLYVESGVFYYKPSTGAFRNIDKESTGTRLNASIINNVIEADDGLIWIATDHGGINVLDKRSFKITYLLNREDDPASLRQNSATLYKDNFGIIWAGTFKEGISYYHKSIIRFPLYKHFAGDNNSLNFEDVDKFAEDKHGNLWIGTNGGGLIYFNRKTGKFTQYKHDPGNANSLSNDIIVSLCIDHEQKLWIGTYFGGLDCFDGKVFTHYKHNDKIAGSISDDRIWSILEDSSNRLWVGTFAGGVNVFNRSTKDFSNPFKQKGLTSPLVAAIFEDRDKNIWICSYSGLDVIIKKSGRIIHYTHNNTPGSLIADNVNDIIQDSRGLMWIVTREGISILNLKTNKFTSLTKGCGLPDNNILNILEDNSGKIWVSTSNGLCRITLIPINTGFTFQFENFNETDGLQGREFNENAALKTRGGEIIFGGGHGFNIFDPLSIRPNSNKLKLVFTNFQLFNNDVAPGKAIDGHIIFSKAISETKSITLNHSENVFTIEFAALNFFNTKVKYQFMLEGVDRGWNTANGATQKATYTNLDGGDYTFKVKAINLDDTRNTDYITLKITVLPPFWKSTLAYIIYLIIISGILLFIRQRGLQKLRRKFTIEQERKEVERMYEIEKLKTKFLTNVSHEFRTPISLIMAPVDKMLRQVADADQKQQLGMIKKNAWRLLNLVNQLLDFRKMEAGETKLRIMAGDIVKFIKEITVSFTDIADSKGIAFLFDTELESLITGFDHDKVERILFNLLSNAFKFTPSGGYVSVLLNLTAEQLEDPQKFIEIKVIDTGIGMPQDIKNRIFDRFFQNDLPGSILNQGSGIGLAITKEFVNIHHGQLFVESEPGQGSCFTVRLPIQIKGEPGAEISPENNSQLEETVTDQNENISKKTLAANERQTVLLVEDNDDFRFYLKDNLKEMFHIIEASNGKEGWQKALAMHPDIVISDISMPEMNGMELCQKIKNDGRTSHIPIILLTALVGQEEELKGLKIGANDYMTKPFNFEILVSKIINLLQLQATFKRTYTRQVNFQLNEAPIMSADEKFVMDIIDHIDQNMLNPSLSVNELSKHMGINRNTLYKKLLMITGKSPVEFIRLLRLKRAVHLLENSQMTIAEVSYQVGFNTPHYFSKSFREEFNMLPSEFIIQNRKQAVEKIESMMADKR